MTIIPENLAINKPDKKLIYRMDKADSDEKILFKKKSDFHTISVVESKIGRFLKYKDTYQAGFINTKVYKGNIPYINYFLIPFLMNKNIQNVLIIGFGSGIIVKQYEEIFEKIKRIDIVDIEEYIFPIAEKYFNFKISNTMNFYLQDALVYLKTTKKKYDLILVDVANDTGIDERFSVLNYLKLINSRLKKGGIFVSNMPSARDIFNKKNKFVLNLLNEYKKVFPNIDLYTGETSNKIYYKTFFNIDEIVLDITNLIIISSDKNYKIQNNFEKFREINVDIESYLNDKVSYYKNRICCFE